MHLLNEETMQAICWTLIHSLWQGLLLAITGGAAIIITKKYGAALRYNVLSTLFFLFVAVAFFTFTRQLHIASAANRTAVVDLSTVHGDAVRDLFVAANNNGDAVVEKNNIDEFISYFNQHASLVVAIWFIIMTAQCIRLLANIGYAQRIRYYKTHSPSVYWQQQLSELAERIQIKKHIVLLESEIVKIPMTVGFLKPVILFPFSLLSQLPPDQVEAVLLHELAHIKRKDYLVNLLQSFAELFFFFNPGVLWISSLIRDERENCCDDIAISETRNKKEFLYALVSFQEYNLNGSKYALAFPGRKNHLLNRVKRIITNNNKTLNNMEKISLAAGIVILGLITIAFRQTAKQEAVKIQTGAKTEPVKEMINDTVPEKNKASTFSLEGSIDGKKYKIKEVNGKVVELYVDGKRITDEKIGGFQPIIDKIHLDAKKRQDELEVQNGFLEKQRAELTEKQEIMNKQEEDLKEQQIRIFDEDAMDKLKKEQDELKIKMELLKRDQEALNHEQSDKSSQDARDLMNKQDKEISQQMLDLKKKQFELMQQSKLMQEKDLQRQNEILMKKQIDLKVQEMVLQNEQLSINKMLLASKLQHELISPTPNVPLEMDGVPTPPAPPSMEGKPINSIIDDLIGEGIIADRSELSFTLNNEILKVNGIVQPKELHAKFKEKYIAGKRDHVIYSKHGGSTHTDVIINK